MKQNENIMHLVSKYAEIIDLQSDVIDDLFALLMQHIAAQELDCLECVKKINKAAALREAAGCAP